MSYRLEFEMGQLYPRFVEFQIIGILHDGGSVLFQIIDYHKLCFAHCSASYHIFISHMIMHVLQAYSVRDTNKSKETINITPSEQFQNITRGKLDALTRTTRVICSRAILYCR